MVDKLLALAMIARNEEKNISRALESVKGTVDAMFIVDTGSKDKTIDIAKSYGATVIQTEWKYDFSYHRNQSINYASEYEWILILDCDEELIIPDPQEFRKRLSKIDPEINALCCLVGEVGPDGKHTLVWPGVRFFRAAGKPYYKYIVHNKVKYEGYAGGTDIMINHYGYKSGEVLQRKYERTKALLQKRLDLDPADFIAMYYIAQIAVGESDWHRVIEYGTKALEYCTITDPQEFQYFGVIYYWIAYAYLKQGDGVNAFPWISKGIEFYPDDIDLNYIMAEYGYLTDQKDLCLEHATRYEKAIDKFRQELTNNPVSFKTVIEHDDMQKRITYCSSDDNLNMISEWRKVYE
jgi:glycosyltransferase involved in cell wall biosynthesis